MKEEGMNLDEQKCPDCGNSNVKKSGLVTHNVDTNEDTHYFQCKNCLEDWTVAVKANSESSK